LLFDFETQLGQPELGTSSIHFVPQGLIDQLQGKVKGYKKQIEEAEVIAMMNLAKYKKVAGALGDAEAVADANEQVG